MTTRRKRISEETTPAELETVVHNLLPVGQQVTITREFKGPGGMMRIGTNSVIEGYQTDEGGTRYKILHRGFRFWIPEEYVMPL